MLIKPAVEQRGGSDPWAALCPVNARIALIEFDPGILDRGQESLPSWDMYTVRYS